MLALCSMLRHAQNYAGIIRIGLAISGYDEIDSCIPLWARLVAILSTLIRHKLLS